MQTASQGEEVKGGAHMGGDREGTHLDTRHREQARTQHGSEGGDSRHDTRGADEDSSGAGVVGHGGAEWTRAGERGLSQSRSGGTAAVGVAIGAWVGEELKQEARQRAHERAPKP